MTKISKPKITSNFDLNQFQFLQVLGLGMTSSVCLLLLFMFNLCFTLKIKNYLFLKRFMRIDR